MGNKLSPAKREDLAVTGPLPSGISWPFFVTPKRSWPLAVNLPRDSRVSLCKVNGDSVWEISFL